MTPDHEPDALLLVNEALDNLAAEAPEKAQLIKLRFFARLSIDEAASASGIDPATAKRDWAFARARLFAEWERMG